MRSAEEALLDLPISQSQPNELSVLVCAIHEDQRPLKGAAGALDWRLRGFLSRFVMNGSIAGKRDEIVYVPIQHHGTVRHLLLVGLGPRANSDSSLAVDVSKRVAKAISSLNFKRVLVSQSSFPFLTEAQLRKAFSGHVPTVEFVQ
jgi:hypothetical protein